MIIIHKDDDHEIRYEPGFNLGSDHKTVQLNCILTSQSNDSVKFSLLDPPTCLDLICSGHTTVKFSFGTRLWNEANDANYWEGGKVFVI